MCAYFFAVSRPANTDTPSPEHLKLKAMVTDPERFKTATEYMPVDIANTFNFDRNNSKHLDILKDCTRLAKQKLEDSMAIDKEASVFSAVGVLAMAGFLPFSWALTPLAFMYSGYLVKERTTAYDEYTTSLDNLVACTKWALNSNRTTQDDINHVDVQSMLDLLKQVMTIEQLKGVIFDPLETEFFAKLLGAKDATTYDNEKKETLSYAVYGYQQGGSLTALIAKATSYLQVAAREAATVAYKYLSDASFTPAPSM